MAETLKNRPDNQNHTRTHMPRPKNKIHGGANLLAQATRQVV